MTTLAHGLEQHPDVAANMAYGKTAGEIATMIERLHIRIGKGNASRLTFGVPSIDAVVKTMWPGTLTVVLGRPSNRKSSTLKHLARVECQRIMAEGKEHEEAICFVSTEEPDEEIGLRLAGAPFGVMEMMDGQVPTADVALWSHTVAGLPMYGVSPFRTDLSKAVLPSPPRFTVEQAYREILRLIDEDDQKRRPTALFFDYVQKAATESRTENEGNQRVAFIVGRIVEIAKKLGVVAVCAAQAKREVDARVPPVPQMDDGMWSASLEHEADTMLSVWYPVKTEMETRAQLNAKFSVRGLDFDNTSLGMVTLMDPTTMVVSLRKQRYGAPTGWWAVKVDPASGALSDWPQPRVTIGGHDVEL